jgi:hypothetical protein
MVQKSDTGLGKSSKKNEFSPRLRLSLEKKHLTRIVLFKNTALVVETAQDLIPEGCQDALNYSE